MSIISGKKLDVMYGEFHILNQVDLTIDEGERVGLVGRNGSGKSTLLRILAGVTGPDTGDIIRRRGLTTGFLPQEFDLDDGATVLQNIRSGAAEAVCLLEEYHVGTVDPRRQVELEKKLSALEGWDLDVRIDTLMEALKVAPKDRTIGTLSGGEKRRVALCRALVSSPGFLILDEPTNHLDTESIEWLESYIQKFRGTLLLVTHDRYFLDRVTTRIIELSYGNLHFYQGNYSRFLEQKAQRQDQELINEQKRQSFIRRELDWVRRGPKARGTKAKGRLDRFYDAVNQDAPKIEQDVELMVPPASKLGNKIVIADGVGMRFGQQCVFDGLSLELAAGQRIGVIGKNGVGKTTLLRILLGELEPSEGRVTIGDTVRFNYIDQSRESLTDTNTVFEEIGEGNDFVMFDNQKIGAWGYLKRFLFSDDRINVKVSELSGGERNRLLLAKIMKLGGNFLILDEPSNDLDLATLRVLEESLVTFAGCVMAVSHDRYFLNRICTHIMAFEADGSVVLHEGNYAYYMEQRGDAYRGVNERSEKVKPAPPKRAERKLKWREQQELNTMEERILQAEEEVSRLEELFSRPDFFDKYGDQVRDLTQELEDAKAVVHELYERWDELEALKG